MTLSTFNSATPIASRRGGTVRSWMIECLGALTRIRRRAATRRELGALSPEQLRDTGIDISEISHGPVFDVPARTMTDLMSMR